VHLGAAPPLHLRSVRDARQDAEQRAEVERQLKETVAGGTRSAAPDSGIEIVTERLELDREYQAGGRQQPVELAHGW
jgi:uncharacterized heparinase superfamily protein